MKLKSTISIIILNVNGLNIAIKGRDCQNRFFKDLTICSVQSILKSQISFK